VAVTYTYAFTALGQGFNYDLTDQMLSFTSDLDAGIFTLGTASAQFTVKNFTSTFTPGAGGTYSTTNWFNAIFKLTLTAAEGAFSATGTIFEGNCTNFSIDSQEQDSKATFTCVDAVSFVSNSKTNVVGTTTAQSMEAKMFELFDLLQFPVVDVNASMAIQSIGVNDGGSSTPKVSGTPTAGSASDLIATRYLPATGTINWPTYGLDVFGLWNYQTNMLYFTPKKSTGYTVGPYKLYGSGIAGSDLPLKTLTAAYNKADFATNAQVTSTTGVVVEAASGASTTTYGTKYISWPQAPAVTSGQEFQTAALVNRYNTFDYVPTSATTNLSMVKALNSYASAATFMGLLDMSSGIWERLELKYIPYGTAVTIISQNVITGRTISGTPEDLTISLRTKQWNNWSAFILDNDFDGILGGGSITYNQPEIVYDEPEWIYNDTNVEQGSRLGW